MALGCRIPGCVRETREPGFDLVPLCLLWKPGVCSFGFRLFLRAFLVLSPMGKQTQNDLPQTMERTDPCGAGSVEGLAPETLRPQVFQLFLASLFEEVLVHG